MDKIVIYGTGMQYKKYFSDMDCISPIVASGQLELIGIVDGDSKKHGQRIALGNDEFVIGSIYEIPKENYTDILITSDQYYEEIKKELVENGIEEKKIKKVFDYVQDFYWNGEYRYKLSLVLIIKDEAAYIEEWIAYHRLMGVEHFYIYDDNSQDGLLDVLKPYLDLDIVTYTFWEHELGQPAAYFDAVTRFKDETKYMGFSDTDEFLVLGEGNNIVEQLERLRESYETELLPYHPTDVHWGGVGVNYRYFGTGFHVNKPQGLVIENFIYREVDTNRDHSFIKSIVNPRIVVDCDVHYMKYLSGYICVSENGSHIPGMNFMDPRYEHIWIHHYWCKSEEEMFAKFERGWIAGFRTETSFEQRKELFKKELLDIRNYNRIKDDRLLEKVPYVMKLMEEIHKA